MQGDYVDGLYFVSEGLLEVGCPLTGSTLRLMRAGVVRAVAFGA